MASRQVVRAYRPLLRPTHPTSLPRRTICYSRPLRAEEDRNKTNGGTPEEPKNNSSWLSSVRDLFFNPGKKVKKPPKPVEQQLPQQGGLAPDSIFADHSPETEMTVPGRAPSGKKPFQRLEDRDPALIRRVIDPNPVARRRWERRMVIREVRKRGRLTKQEVIMATEREALVKSHWFKTSVKKLVPLARQIQGKNVDEAILQMRFSKKKVAKEVLEHLKYAKNEAIVRYGMGLGKANGETEKHEPIDIILKDGEKKTITDPTSIYIAQAWVNRGPFDVDYDHRARGKINLLRPPHTGISVLLKEQKTQVREWNVRQARALRQRKSMLWVHLPDRPVTAQSQYYSW
ncbi:ribosomal protein L22/L17 [Talaromyces proteolyticus]|uniref:Ribosomal protein L22/L17 n=1 Tax=Talaromyces proteolyticus TaxID=1131652 RepID=A0AAD4KJI7_9EURO|nr:ribosomal protein L22/L17 [Talaromyces proteolyticus]KAH8693900.1 ribosomal protein L22/L17 [Talaromyces proteolyticus]